jgi:hypothetical protein
VGKRRAEELETVGYRWSAEDEADMRVTDAQEDWTEEAPRKPPLYETGWLFEMDEIA